MREEGIFMLRISSIILIIILLCISISLAKGSRGMEIKSVEIDGFKIEKISYKGWPNCIKMSNVSVEIIITTDVGPRIISFGFKGKDNEFFEDPSQIGKTGGKEWKLYGGHRLWIAPEEKPRTYYPDNNPVRYEIKGNTVRLISETENTTGMEKEIEVTLEENHVKVIHRVTNHNLWDTELALWALTVMNSGGKAIIPQEEYMPNPGVPDTPGQKIDPRYYLPVRNMILWSYTRLNDPRWLFTGNYIILKQDINSKKPQKLGVSNGQKWAAYARKDHLFVKKFDYKPDGIYPDMGCNFETFTNQDMLEMESLGPLTKLAPGKSITHQEDWYLFDNVKFEDNDESINKNILPLIKTIN
jgi:hypothetical protein